MNLYNIDYLKYLCKKYGLFPSRKYGQNFLINEESIAKMLEAGEVKKDDVIVEIGPGFGVLTLALAEKVNKVVAFEIEKKLTTYWNSIIGHPELVSGSTQMPKQVRHDNIEIVWGNVLNEFQGESFKVKWYKVIANLPYQITSNVIRKFLEAENKPELMVLMVQKEVAERICAQPGNMSVLSVSVQYYAEPEIVMQVPRTYFWPIPAVDSAIIKITPRKSACHSDGEGGISVRKLSFSQEAGIQTTTQSDTGFPIKLGMTDKDPSCARDDMRRHQFDEQFFKIVKAGFASRRKMLIKNLSSVADKKKLAAAFGELGIDEKARAQELSVEQWRQIVIKLSSL